MCMHGARSLIPMLHHCMHSQAFNVEERSNRCKLMDKGNDNKKMRTLVMNCTLYNAQFMMIIILNKSIAIKSVVLALCVR